MAGNDDYIGSVLPFQDDSEDDEQVHLRKQILKNSQDKNSLNFLRKKLNTGRISLTGSLQSVRPDSAYLQMTQISNSNGYQNNTKEYRIAIDEEDENEQDRSSKDIAKEAALKKELVQCITKKNISEFKTRLVEFKSNINWTTGRMANTPLHYAAQEGNSEMVQEILQLDDVEINVKNNKNQTPLFLAAMDGHIDVLKLLLHHGADPMIADAKSNIPLHVAAYNGKERCCKELAGMNDKQIKKRNHKKETPLICASINGHKKCCKFLIDDINVKDKEGNTPLHCAAKRGFYTTVKFLLEEGADFKLKNNEKYSPTYLAAAHPCKETLEILFSYYELSTEESHEKNGKLKRTIAHSAAANSIECLKYLVTKLEQQFFNIRDSEGNAPLHLAIKANMSVCAEVLLSYGAQVDFINQNYKSILHLAAEKDMAKILSITLSKDRSMINKTDGDNLSPLLIAVKYKNIDCLKVLLKRSARTSCVDNDSKNALHIAAEINNEEACKLLLSQKVPVDEEDDNGNTPFQLAVIRGNLNCCKILLKKSRMKLMRLNRDNKFLFELAFEEKMDPVFYWLLFEMSKLTFNEDKLIIPLIHTFMHQSIEQNRKTCVEGIIQSKWWEGSFRMYSGIYEEEVLLNNLDDLPCTNFNNLIKMYPDLADDVMDKCVVSRVLKNTEEIKYNYRIIENTFYIKKEDKIVIGNPFDETTQNLKNNAAEIKCDINWMSKHALSTMVKENKLDLLKHPLVTSWLNNKWTSYIGIFIFIQFIGRIGAALIVSAMQMYLQNWQEVKGEYNATEEDICQELNRSDNSSHEIYNYLVEYQLLISWLLSLTAVVILLTLLGEVLKWWKFGRTIFTTFWVKELRVVRVVLMLLTIIPTTDCDYYTGVRQVWQWKCGVVGVLLYWFQTINAMNKIPAFSIFLPITMTFVKKFLKISLFIFIIVTSFGFVFHLTLNNVNGFDSISESIIKTIILLRGDLGYDDTFFEIKLKYPWLAKYIFVFFVSTVAGFFANLLVSSPFAYINEYIKTAELHKYSLSVEQCLTCEVFFPAIRRKWVIAQETVTFNTKGWKERLTKSCRLFVQERLDRNKITYLEDNKPDVEDLMKYISPQFEKLQNNLKKVNERIAKLEEKLTKLTE